MACAYHVKTQCYTGRMRLLVGKVPVDVVSFSQALSAVEALVLAKQGGFVFTPNIDHVVTAEDNPAFAAAYARTSLSLADGMPIVWASRLLGTPLPERVAGSDLVAPLLELAGQRNWRVAFFGAGPGVADKAAAIAREKWSTNVISTDAPMVNLNDSAQIDAIAAALAAQKPDLVLFALGAPKQELLMAAISERVKPAVLLGIGASLDFIAGTVKRAPALMRKTGFEWLYRLVQEPRRLWRRYLVNDPKFLVILLKTMRARA